MATTFFKRLRSLRRSIFACSLASDIPRLLLVSVENVPRMVNVLCGSIPRGSDIPRQSPFMDMACGNVTASRLPLQSTRPYAFETKWQSRACDRIPVFTGPRIISIVLPLPSSPPPDNIKSPVNCAMNLRGNVYTRGGDSRRFSVVVGRTWPVLPDSVSRPVTASMPSGRFRSAF